MELPGDVGDAAGPAAVVDYFVDPTPALLPLVRAIGVLAVAYGVVVLLTVPVDVAYRYQWYATANAPPVNAFYRANEVAGVVFSIVSGIWLIVAGVGCLRRAGPRGRRVLTTCAWACLAFAAYGLAVNVGYTLSQGAAGRYTTTALLYLVGYQFRVSISHLVLPVVVLVLFRQRTVRDAFIADDRRI